MTDTPFLFKRFLLCAKDYTFKHQFTWLWLHCRCYPLTVTCADISKKLYNGSLNMQTLNPRYFLFWESLGSLQVLVSELHEGVTYTTPRSSHFILKEDQHGPLWLSRPKTVGYQIMLYVLGDIFNMFQVKLWRWGWAVKTKTNSTFFLQHLITVLKCLIRGTWCSNEVEGS